MTERIVGKIAKITSDREVIINRGSEHGVEAGTYFSVKDKPLEVTDPDTGEVLGEVSPVKVVVRVEEVSEKFCIARTFRRRKVKVQDATPGNPAFGAFSGSGSLGQMLQPPKPAKYETRVETLRFDPQRGEPISAVDSIVSVGDVVESVLQGEDIDPVTTTLYR